MSDEHGASPQGGEPIAGFLPTEYAQLRAATPSRSRTPLIAALVAGALVAVGGGYAVVQYSHRASVALTVAVSAPDGGVFADSSSCSLREEFGTLDDPGNLQVIDYEGDTQEFTPQWQLENENTCIARELVDLDKTKRYYVSLGGSRLGDLSSVDIVSGEARLLRTIKVTRDLSGVLVIGQTADSCRGSVTSWRCTWYTYSFSLDLNEDTGHCSGTGGYADIEEGINVTIYDSTGGVAASGSITDSTYDLRSIKSKVIVCKLLWSIKNVPNDDAGYSIEVGKRGKVYFDTTSLERSGWVANTRMGD